MENKKHYPFEIQYFMVRNKDDKTATAAPIDTVQQKIIKKIKEEVDIISERWDFKPKMRLYLSRYSVERIEVIANNIKRSTMFVEELQEAMPDIVVRLVATFTTKKGLPDELLYKAKAGRGTRKAKHKEDFNNSLPESEINPNGKEAFENALKIILSKRDFLE